MRIHLLSDVHTEFMNKINLNAIEHLKHTVPAQSDVIVLAGDIGESTAGMIWARATFPKHTLIYVAGNHEYYHHDIGILSALRKMAKLKGIHFLENDAIEIDDVRFLGCTLWTDFCGWGSTHVWNALTNINDYFKITAKDWYSELENVKFIQDIIKNGSVMTSIDNHSFHPIVAYAKHRESIAWLEGELLKPCDKKTMVVTHHAPSERSLIGARKTSVEFAYCSRLENFIEKHKDAINCWVHGHVHQPVDYKISGVRITSNPRGYPVQPSGVGIRVLSPEPDFYRKVIEI